MQAARYKLRYGSQSQREFFCSCGDYVIARAKGQCCGLPVMNGICSSGHTAESQRYLQYCHHPSARVNHAIGTLGMLPNQTNAAGANVWVREYCQAMSRRVKYGYSPCKSRTLGLTQTKALHDLDPGRCLNSCQATRWLPT